MLQIGQPYYIILEMTNNAELITQIVSKPIIVDIVGPTAGRVIDGTDFKHDLIFHGDANKFEGDDGYVLIPLYYINYQTNKCIRKNFMQ